jgi:CRISPR-associated protein Cmr2
MSHLLAISIGPVQEFIAAARRTRDLWFGSYLLSEISKAAAKCVRDDHGGILIFPHPATNLESGHPEINVANVILSELNSGDLRTIANNARKAAQGRWENFAKDAWDAASSVFRSDMWDDQINDVIEFYAAWIPHTNPAKYRENRAKVMRLLAGRKNCRDFSHAKLLDTGLPKSSLDGQRATVLVGPEQGQRQVTYRNKWPNKIRRRLRIRSGEQLDVVGVVKRIGEGDKRFPSVSRIAADIWIRGILGRGGADIVRRFAGHCDSLPQDVVHRLNGFPQFRDFPFEGTTIFRSRHHEWWEETEDAPESEQRREPPNWYAGFDGELKLVEDYAAKQGIGKDPSPYLAILVADGDKVGAVISNRPTADENREFSRALSRFAEEARKTVNAHNGILIYAGGDDVLAFLPVDKCLACARQLRNSFVEMLKDYKNASGESPTLSAGIAIGHFMENLEDLLEYGRAAEKAAKKVGGKDALAVHLHKRGGSPIRVRARWLAGDENKIVLHKDEPREKAFDLKEFNERLMCYAELILTNGIPGKLPYDLRKLADLYKGWRSETRQEKQTVAEAMNTDVVRVIRDKQPTSGRQYMPEIERIVRTIATPNELEQFTDELLVARQIATVLQQVGEAE